MAVIKYKDADGNWQTLPSVGPRGPAGQDGANGASAYELAVEQGYTGTLAEWLAEMLRTADIANNLTTEDSGKVLSALQGKLLNDALTLKAQCTLLYTNASPGSAFAAQTLALDLSAYDSALVEYYVNVSTLGYLPSIRVAIGRENLMAMTIADGSRYTRNVSVNAAGLTFGDAYLNGQSVSNASNVPLRIFGVKGV